MGFLEKLDSGVPISFTSYKQFAQLVLDVAEAIDGKLEYAVDYDDTHAQLAWYTHSEVRTEELQTHECTPHKTLRPFTHAQLGGLENKSIRKEMTDGTVHT